MIRASWKEVFENLNTQPVKRGQKFYYQVWLDTTQFSANNKENIQTVGITDNYDESKLIVTKNTIKVYDGETGARCDILSLTLLLLTVLSLQT